MAKSECKTSVFPATLQASVSHTNHQSHYQFLKEIRSIGLDFVQQFNFQIIADTLNSPHLNQFHFSIFFNNNRYTKGGPVSHLKFLENSCKWMAFGFNDQIVEVSIGCLAGIIISLNESLLYPIQK